MKGEEWAERILRNKLVMGKEYDIVEVEFYYFSQEHPDIFTHKHPLQCSFGQWYFHRAGHKWESGYKGGSYKGLDITIGNENVYGGILIRSIRAETLIEGPSKVVDEILSQTQCQSIHELVEKMGTTSIDNPILTLKNNLLESSLEDVKIYSSPRVGLSLKGTKWKLKREYLMKPYRFFTTNALKKGQIQIILARYIQNEQVQGKKKYIEAFKRGRERKDVDISLFQSNLNVEMTCEMYGYCSLFLT